MKIEFASAHIPRAPLTQGSISQSLIKLAHAFIDLDNTLKNVSHDNMILQDSAWITGVDCDTSTRTTHVPGKEDEKEEHGDIDRNEYEEIK